MGDLTKGPPLKQIVLFSVPLIIGNLFQMLYSVMDTLIVGRTLGVKALGGIGVAGSVIDDSTGTSLRRTRLFKSSP